MPQQWTGHVISQMHIHGISRRTLAERIGWTPGYIGMVLNGKRSPRHAEYDVTRALEALIAERTQRPPQS